MDVGYVESEATLREAERGYAMADFECQHGSLPHDKTLACDCWGLPIERLPIDLNERIAWWVRNRSRDLSYEIVYNSAVVDPERRAA